VKKVMKRSTSSSSSKGYTVDGKKYEKGSDLMRVLKASVSEAKSRNNGNGSKTPQARNAGANFGTEVKVLEPLNVNALRGSTLTSRIMEQNGVRWYEIREYVESEGYTGFTKRGVRLNLKSLQALAKQWPTISKLVKAANGSK
jgi:hypothetical protein